MSQLITSRTRRRGSGPKSVAMSAKAPSGTLHADAVPTIQCRRAPRGPQPATASRATRVLPTPAAPDNTIPVARSAAGRVASAITASSSERPISGHWRITGEFYPAQPLCFRFQARENSRREQSDESRGARTYVGGTSDAAASLASASRMNVGSASRSTPTHSAITSSAIPASRNRSAVAYGNGNRCRDAARRASVAIHERSHCRPRPAGVLHYPNPDPLPTPLWWRGSFGELG